MMYSAHFLDTQTTIIFSINIDVLISRGHDKRPVSGHLHTGENHVVRHVINVRRRLRRRRTVCVTIRRRLVAVAVSRPCHVMSVQKPGHQTILVSLGVVIGGCPDVGNNNNGDGKTAQQ